MSQTVLVVAAHPDDELLGCGATVVRHTTRGDDVHALILATGVAARSTAGSVDDRTLERLRDAARRAAQVAGSQPPRFAELPDNRMDGVNLLDIVKPIESVLADLRPSVVYTHHGGDLNVDHQLTYRAVLTACRPVPGSTVTSVYAFETPSSTEWGAGALASPFIPNRFHDVSGQLERKIEALSCYVDELRDFPHPRSVEAVEALARWRGATAGVRAAEAFQVLREVS